ncbi:MAG: flagellar filament capping protein FliD [Phycisphaerales bacterium]
MGGITTGTGIFSGINTSQLISQLLSIESRPKVLIQNRMAQLQQQQAGYLDINSKLSSLKDAAAALRLNNAFQTKKAVSGDPDVLTATATASAAPGTFQFIVDRLVSSQQRLSHGFASSSLGLNAGSFTFESEQARLDRDARLADLNGGAGVSRGKIVITETTGGAATIDLSKTATVGEVLDAINTATGINVTASIQDDRIVLTQNGGLNIAVTNGQGYTTATSLGIERTAASSATLTGTEVYRLGTNFALSLLNDGNGIAVGNQVGDAFDFQIHVTPSGGSATVVSVNLGDIWVDGEITESGVTTIGGVIARINTALADEGFTDVTASVSADGAGLRLVDAAGTKALLLVDNATTIGDTLADLGFTSAAGNLSGTGTLTGGRVLAGMNSTLATKLNGGLGIGGDGTISITTRDGTVRSVTIDRFASFADILREFSADTGGAVTAALDENGTGVVLTDTTGGVGNLIVTGVTAESLGIDTVIAGVASSTIASGSLQHQYLTVQTKLSSLNGGTGVGTGRFNISDSTGATDEVTIGENDATLGDIIKRINSNSTRVEARLNAGGDGIELYEPATGGGILAITVEDETGNVAGNLNIEGEAETAGPTGTINGSFERVVEFEATDGLDAIVTKINEARVGIAAAVINDGAGGTPYRLSLTATTTGSAGRMVIDTGGFDLGLATLDTGNDARVFFGSTDPAKAVLLSSSANTLDGVITGVSIDLNGTSAQPVSLTITRDTAAVEGAVQKFIEAFNGVVDRINTQTRYVAETKTKGPLLGDGASITLRNRLFETVQGKAIGVNGAFDRLADVGVTVGSGGKLELDKERLREAIEEDPQGVADLFAARVLKPKTSTTLSPGITFNNPDAEDEFLSLGVTAQLEELATDYVGSVDGILTGRRRTLDDQIAAQRRRIEEFDVRLESRRQILERQFLAMEQAIGSLQSQQGALASLGQLG